MAWIVANNGLDVHSADEQFTPICTAESKVFAKEISALPDLIMAAQKFVNKVESGKARSTETYNELKSALLKAGY